MAGAEVILQVLRESVWVSQDSVSSDATGGYVFEQIATGRYRVIARSSTGDIGASGAFDIDGDDAVRIVVVLVPFVRGSFVLIPTAGESVQSVVAQGSGIEAVPSGAAWILDLQEGMVDTLVATMESSSGTRMERYAIAWDGNTAVVVALGDAPTASFARLLADWTFDESDTLVDHSGQGNTGVRHGGVSALSGESAWRFDGTSGYVSLGGCLGSGGTCVDWSDTDLVMQMRVRLDTQTVSVVAHLVTISAGNGEVMVKRIPGDTVAFVLAAPSGWVGLNIPWTSRLGKWVDIVFVRDAAAGRGVVYLDGLVFGSFEIPAMLNKVDGIPPALGAYTSGSIRYFARMDMERMRVWLGKFDSAQVTTLHKSL